MSCFESSTFLKNSQHMDQRILIKACDRLGWTYQRWGNHLYIRQGKARFGHENGLIIKGNKVLYDEFARRQSNAQIEVLRDVYQNILVEYAGESIRDAFESEGFTVKTEAEPNAPSAWKDDSRPGFLQRVIGRDRGSSQDGPALSGSTVPLGPVPAPARRFTVSANSTLPGEDEPYTEIAFAIYADGTIVSDSNYIPRDVHDRADRAMEKLDHFYGSRRREGIEIRRKPIPEAYREKAFCKPKKKIGEVV